MFASAEGKKQNQVRQLQCQEHCIDHIPYYLSELSRAQFLRQPFKKQLYTKTIIPFNPPELWLYECLYQPFTAR